MLWVFLALMSNFFWAFGNITDKVLRTRYLRHSIALTASFGVFGILVFLISLWVIGIPNLPFAYFIAALLSGAFLIYAVIFYLKALSIEEASRVVPLWHLSSVFTLVLAVIFLQEILTAAKYAAFASILAGGFLISTRRVKKLFRISPALLYMLVSSFLLAISDVLLKFAHSISMFWQVFLVFYAGVVLSQLSFFILRTSRKRFLKASKNYMFLLLLFFSIFFGFLGILFWNNAVLLGPITLISVFVSFQSLFVLIIATILSIKFPMFIKEAVDFKTIGIKLMAIFLMGFGLYLLSV